MPLVLDDNVIRSLGHGEITAEPFVVLREEGISVHIADGAMGELAHQLLEGRFPWPNWLVARDALRRFIDAAEPVLLGGRLGLYRAGIRGAADKASTAEVASAVEYTSKWWDAFMRVEHFTDVTLPTTVGNSVLGLSPEATKREVAALKDEWVESFDTQRLGDELVAAVQEEMRSRADPIEQMEGLVAYIGNNLDARTQGGAWPPASLRLDAMIRVYVLLQLNSMRQRDPYDAEKHQNDSFDHDLLRYLAYPAAICTLDRGIARKLKRAKCWQAPWVVEPEELASVAVRLQIRTLDWPAPVAS